jgi:hypothetical protein
LNKAKKFKNQKILYAFFTPYILTILITIVIGTISYINSISAIVEEIKISNQAILTKDSEILKEKLLVIEKIAANIAGNNEYLRSIRLKNNIYDPLTLFSTKKLISDLATYQNQADLIKSIFIYLPKLNSVISDTGLYSSDIFSETEFYNIFDNESFKDNYAKSSFRGYSANKSSHQIDTSVITFQQSLDFFGNDESGSVVIIIDSKNIEQLLKSSALYEDSGLFFYHSNNDWQVMVTPNMKIFLVQKIIR